MEQNPSTLIEVGRIGRPVGLKGMCRVVPFGTTLREAQYPLRLLCGSPQSQREVEIASCTESGPDVVKVMFSGIATCDQVDILKNQYLYLSSELMPPVEEDEYYFYQLKGLAVVSETGEKLGKVVEVYKFPTTDAIEIAVHHTGEKVLFPFRKETVLQVSLEKGEVVIEKEHLSDLL